LLSRSWIDVLGHLRIYLFVRIGVGSASVVTLKGHYIHFRMKEWSLVARGQSPKKRVKWSTVLVYMYIA